MLGLAEMKAMAHHGAGVLNERAIDYAMEHGVTLYARRAHGDGGQTVLRPELDAQRSRIDGVACHESLLRVDFTEETDPAHLATLLDGLETFAPELARGGRGSYLLHTEQLADVPGLTAAIESRCPRGVRIHAEVASVSAIGLHAGRDPDAPEFARARLSAAGIQVQRAFATAHAVTCLVEPGSIRDAMSCFHETFRIGDTAVAHVA
jgi:aspartokinase